MNAAVRRPDPPALGDVPFGSGLVRPECVLATRAGDLFTAARRPCIAVRVPTGRRKPNGIALRADGSFLVTHLGATEGGVFQLTRSGIVTPWLRRIDGLDLPPTNSVLLDAAGGAWVTVSARLQPRALGYRRSCADGFTVRVDARGAGTVADGLGYTTEVAMHPSGRWLYVNQTFSRRLSRFAVRADGSLGAKEVVCEFGPGSFPDGLAFDEAVHAWVVSIASIVSNRLIRVAPDGSQTVWLEDAEPEPEPEHQAWVEAAFDTGQVDRRHRDGIRSRRLRNISSIAFAGADRRTGVLDCLLGDRLESVRLPAAGVAPTHWEWT